MRLLDLSESYRSTYLADTLGKSQYVAIRPLLGPWANSSLWFRGNIMYPFHNINNDIEWSLQNISRYSRSINNLT